MPPEKHITHSYPFTRLGQSPWEEDNAWNGYQSVPLHPDDQHYTTFITPWDCYGYPTTPQGYIASGDHYNDKITSSIPNKTKCMDDTLS